MPRLEKRLQKMAGRPKGWRYRQAAAILEALGFQCTGASGSHRLWKHESGVRIGLVECRGKMPEEYVKDMVSILQEAGLFP